MIKALRAMKSMLIGKRFVIHIDNWYVLKALRGQSKKDVVVCAEIGRVNALVPGGAVCGRKGQWIGGPSLQISNIKVNIESEISK